MRLRATFLGAVMLATTLAVGHGLPTAAATPAFVQARATEITSGRTARLTFTNASIAGNLIVVAVVWNNSGAVTVRDSRGNVYRAVAPRRTWASRWSEQVFYAKNVAAGRNTVTATFATPITRFGTLYAHEYSGIDRATPIDGQRSAIGSAAAMSSGPLTTRTSGDLLFAVAASNATVTRAGPIWTTRSTAFGNRTVDRRAAGTGAYRANSRQSGTRGSSISSPCARPIRPALPSASPRPAAGARGQRHRHGHRCGQRQRQRRRRAVLRRRQGDRERGHRRAVRPRLGHPHRRQRRPHHDGAGPRRGRQPDDVARRGRQRHQRQLRSRTRSSPPASTCRRPSSSCPTGACCVAELAGRIKILPPPYTAAEPDAVPAAHRTSARRASSRASTTSRSTPTSPTNRFYYVFYTLGHAEPGSALAVHRQRRRHRHGRRAASSCCTRTRRTPTPSTTAGRSCSATTASSTSRPASTSTPALAQQLDQPARQDPPHQPGRHGPDRQPVLRRRRAERRLDLGLRPAQPVPRPTTTRRPAGCSSATSAATTTRRRRRRSTSASAGANYGWPNSEGPCSAPCTSPLYSYAAQRSRLRRHRRVRLPRHPVPGRLPGQLLLRRLHPELDQAAHLRRQRQRHRGVQLRARRTARSTGRTATSST